MEFYPRKQIAEILGKAAQKQGFEVSLDALERLPVDAHAAIFSYDS